MISPERLAILQQATAEGWPLQRTAAALGVTSRERARQLLVKAGLRAGSLPQSMLPYAEQTAATHARKAQWLTKHRKHTPERRAARASWMRQYRARQKAATKEATP